MNITDLIAFLASACAVIFVLVPHECAHAIAAYLNGDPTAKTMGRISLNPVKHFDPIGFLCCALVGFGWAKPVPINPYNFKNYKKGMFFTAIAGVVVNYMIAFIFYAFYAAFNKYAYVEMALSNRAMFYFAVFINTFLYNAFLFSLCVFVFNLLPFYPLDGFRVIEALTRPINPVHRFLRQYGQIILLLLIFESFLCGILSRYVEWANYIDILGYVLTFARKIVGYPIVMAWSWI